MLSSFVSCLAASPARRLLGLAPPVARFGDRIALSFFFGASSRYNIVPLFLLFVAGFMILVGPHLRHFSESDCASGLFDVSVSGILCLTWLSPPQQPRGCRSRPLSARRAHRHRAGSRAHQALVLIVRVSLPDSIRANSRRSQVVRFPHFHVVTMPVREVGVV